MKKQLIILMSLLTFISKAQSIEKSSIDSGGASLSVGGIEILYTIGEVNLAERSSATVSMSEGFINNYNFSTLGINDIESLENSIIIYPNPASEYINITSIHTINKVELFNLLGKQVLNTTETNQIKISHLPTGIFLVKAYSDKGITTKKIIIQ